MRQDIDREWCHERVDDCNATIYPALGYVTYTEPIHQLRSRAASCGRRLPIASGRVYLLGRETNVDTVTTLLDLC